MSIPWDGLLNAGDPPLWKGCVTTAFPVSRNRSVPMLSGLLFGGFALIWTTYAATAKIGFWGLGAVHWAAALFGALYAVVHNDVAKRDSSYSLTNRHDIIVFAYPWSALGLHKMRITPKTKRKTDHEHTVKVSQLGRIRRHTIPTRASRSSRIDDTQKVLHLMQQIQKETP